MQNLGMRIVMKNTLLMNECMGRSFWTISYRLVDNTYERNVISRLF